MNEDQLQERLRRYGADENGIRERFFGDADLYKLCLTELLNEQNVGKLEQAMTAGDYTAAFEAAHALKGLAGNLGLTPFYHAVCTLVESLRWKRYGSIAAEYGAVRTQFARLERLVLPEETPLEREPSLDGENGPAEKGEKTRRREKRKRKIDKAIAWTVAAVIFVEAIVILSFYCMIVSYRKNIVLESASHLEEVNSQLRLYVEENVDNDWKSAYSIADSLKSSRWETAAGLRAFLQREREIWEVTNIILYTASGGNLSADGGVSTVDVAAETAYQAITQGEYMTILNSSVIYTIPVETDISYQGSPVVALSLEQDLASLLDRMDFSSFDGAANLYLTQNNGAVISRLTHPNAKVSFNILPVLKDGELESVSREGLTPEDMLTSPDPAVFLLDGGGKQQYVVSTPINARRQSLRLFYFVPEDAVNQTLNGFTKYVATLCLIVFLVFMAGAGLVFALLYKTRKRLFDQAILTRERMFDLLIQNTRTAFALLTVGEDTPGYVSSNTMNVVGENFLPLKKDGDVFCMARPGGGETETVRQMNAAMRDWDGESEFNSGFIRTVIRGREEYFEMRLFPVEGGRGEYVGVAQNMTKLYERETAAKDALAMAERANEAKSRFLSNMSHDIRTPMNAIVNMTDFALENMGNPKKLRECLETIRESSDHLLHLVNDVLDMSRIESGQAVISSEPFDIRAEMKSLGDIVRPLCAARGQTFLMDDSALHTSGVLGDRVKVSQILMNLLSNAMKFTPERGAVRFTVEELPSLRVDIVSLRFTVEDTGIGISEKDIQRVFDPFMRVDDKRVSRIEGTGLGLSICKNYVAAMGGGIRCESEEGSGSIFTVELFFQKADGVPSYPREGTVFLGETPFAGDRCLLCEDNKTNQTIAKTMLERLGFLVEIASDGQEGVAAFNRSRPGYFHVIYMDIQMPVMDGYQATVAIREGSHPEAGTIPIIAMTANVFAEDIERARIAGMDGHLGKPLMTMDIIEQTRKAIGNRRGKPA